VLEDPEPPLAIDVVEEDSLASVAAAHHVPDAG
jgi:hypothetical protein